MDLTQSIEARSDQMNADDLIGGERTFSITRVTSGTAEQPVDVHLAEFPRPWKPSKGMRRVLVLAWGKESDAYIGKRVTLFREPTIRFGKEQVGGIRIRALSGIGKQMRVALTVARGKKEPLLVDALPDDAPTSPPVSEESVARMAELRAEWQSADPDRKKEIEDEVSKLNKAGEPA